MLGYLNVPREDFPFFHANNVIVGGKLLYWKGWVKVKIDGGEHTFFGHRDTDYNAMQDTSRRAILYLRHRYDDVFAKSFYRFVPQNWDDGNRIMVPYPDDMSNDLHMEVIREIITGAGQYEQLRGEYLKAHEEIIRLLDINLEQQRTIESLQGKLEKGQAESLSRGPITWSRSEEEKSYSYPKIS